MVEALDDTRPANTTEAVEALFGPQRRPGQIQKGVEAPRPDGPFAAAQEPCVLRRTPDSPDEAK